MCVYLQCNSYLDLQTQVCIRHMSRRRRYHSISSNMDMEKKKNNRFD